MYIKFLLPDGSVGKKFIIFGLNMISSVHIDNKVIEILTFGKGPTKGLDDTTLTSETRYSLNFTRPGAKFCFILHYNGTNPCYENTSVKSKSF